MGPSAPSTPPWSCPGCAGRRSPNSRKQGCALRLVGVPVQSARMDLLLAVAKPWAYWIAPIILVFSVLGVLGVILQYVFKVVAAKYPKT